MELFGNSILIFPLIIVLLGPSPADAAVRGGVSHEDIRDAVLSLAHMFRDSTDKLERHEYRERQLGEQLKKMLAGLDKRGRDHESGIKVLTDTMIRIESRLDAIEKNLENKNNNLRDKETYTVDTMNESIQLWMNSIESLVRNQSTYLSNNQNILEAADIGLNAKIDRLASSVERLESIVLRPTPTPSVDLVSYEGVLNKFENKLLQLQTTPEDWQKNIQEKLNDQGNVLVELRELTNNAVQSMNLLPNKYDIISMSNSSSEELEKVKYELTRATDKTLTQLEERLDTIKSDSSRNHDNLMKAVTDTGTMAEGLYADVQKSYDQLSNEVKALTKVEQVLIQTADNVLDTKRRIEYGVHQILLEVGDLVKTQAKDLNTTVNKRFDDISETIVVNHNGGFNNLSSKIETEISQVWRQIGIMYQQLTASAGALDRLQQQTEAYVNGSIQTMDSMEGKVGLITSRMTEVDDNLNYLLGRLSLVTQEFNQIKTGLGAALDNIRSSFLSVQDKVKDVGPGPKPIDSSAIGDEDNKL